ncbi:hypothetical protein NP493_833g00036 [Ridgeia piscesae]|uniref:Uncharacterized protein n=1 Tax=Ridgeia piscesae TaxID=27915 RepID=A0AAD9NMI0_RIDPI|nr:hypothetical protein NP493_833g00036 [Ridgeia piscesae]
MSPENGKCKFKDELLTMAAYKEWVCQDPKGDICSARCQFCTKSIYIGNGGRYSLDCHAWTVMLKVRRTRITPKLSDVRAVQMCLL